MTDSPEANVDENKAVERRQFLTFLGLSLFVSLFLMRNYARGLPDNVSLWGYLFFWWAAISSAAFWHLIFTGIHKGINRWSTKWANISFVSICLIFNIALLTDATIYGIYRFHFNGMVWNLLTTPGAGDSFTIGFATYATAVFYICSIIGFIIGIPFLLKKAQWFQTWLPSRKTTVIVLLSFASVLVTEKTIQIIGDVNLSRDIARTRETTPFYIHMSMKRFLRKTFGIKPTQKSISVSNSSLNYPKAPLQFNQASPNPNILIMFIEGARFDCLNEKCMPRLHQFGEQHVIADQHYSGGNASRFGIFSALYGLNATYWHSILAERRSPVLIDELQRRDYQFGIYSSTNLNFPEFRQTAFVNLSEDVIHDDLGKKKIKADARCADGIIELMQSNKPWFGFTFFDASHQPYRYPKEDAVFKVEKRDINYIKLADRDTFDQNMFNKYQNSLHYIDKQIGRIIDALHESKQLENTIVVIIGDHGEAFGELGYFGHNSTFSRYQTQTPCVIHIPKATPQRITRITSHYDIPATIFEYLQCSNDPSDYGNGYSLFNQSEHQFLIMASWSQAAVLVDDHFIQTGYQHGNFGYTIYDRDWQEIPDAAEFLGKHPGAFDFLIKRSNAFRH